MQLLGTVGSLYMFLLLLVMFIGCGLALWRLVDFAAEHFREQDSAGGKNAKTPGANSSIKTVSPNNLHTRISTSADKWIKLSIISLAGILISAVLLRIVGT